MYFFFIKNIFVDFFIVIMIANILFSYLNYKSRTFLGNSGSFFLPFLFGALFISAYNNDMSITADEIVILMLIPGIDLIRLFFLRLLKKTSPFRGDKNHIHHLLLKKYSSLVVVVTIQFLIWLPFLILQIFGTFYIALFIQLFTYIFLILRYKN
jgi:UDP-GlcNAc:undecaprenyl-phosphate GlcNAc-1-phosphate transferase